MSYAVAPAILIVLILSLFDPRLALVAGTGLVLGLVASALWARAQQSARFNSWLLRGLGVLAGVLLLLAVMLGAFMVLSPSPLGRGDGDVGPTFLAPRYEGTGVYRNDGWNLTDRIVFEQDALTTLKEQEATALLAPQLRAQGWSPRRINATRVFVRTRRESAKARWFPATTSRQLQITMPAAITLPDGSELPFTPGEQSSLTLRTAPYVVSHTGPSASREAISGREVLRIDLDPVLVDLDPVLGEPADVQVQLLSPLFRNMLGATLAGLSFGGAVKWIVLLAAAVGAEQIKQILLVPLARLFRRFRIPAGEEASPSSQRRP